MTRHLVLSRYLRVSDVVKVVDAAAYAFCIGQQLNCHLTVHIDKARIAHSGAHTFFVNVMHSAATWVLRQTGKSIAYVYVIENPPPDSNRGGLNIHIALHLPRKLRSRFRRMLTRWVVHAGGHYQDGVLKLGPIYHADNSDDQSYLRSGLRGLFAYLSKGMDPAADNPLSAERKNQGVVHGKRSGLSQSLRPGVRQWTAERIERLAEVRNVFKFDVLKGVVANSPDSEMYHLSSITDRPAKRPNHRVANEAASGLPRAD